jgi:hypothetical protein
MSMVDHETKRVHAGRVHSTRGDGNHNAVSLAVWVMISWGLLLDYISGLIYIIQIYLRTIDADGFPDEAMFDEPLYVIAIKYGAGLTSKMYDYVSLGGRILAIIGVCILSLTLHYSRSRLAQTFMVLFGSGAVISMKPLLYTFRTVDESDLVLPFTIIVSSGFAGWFISAIAVYWADIFIHLTASIWWRLSLSSLIVIGVLLLTSSPLIGALSCSNGGTFMPEVVTYAVSVWMSLIPILFLVWSRQYRKSDYEDNLPFYTPESTPILKQ